MEEQHIYQYLQKLDGSRRRLSEEERSVLYELALHPDSRVRSGVAALLIDHYEEKSEQVLYRLTYDFDSMVRADAVDSLCLGRREKTLQRLLELAEGDPDFAVRGLAVHSSYDVFVNMFGDSDSTHKTAAGVYKPLLGRESNPWVQTCYHCVLYLCGEKAYLEPLIDNLDSDNFYVRNSVLDTFADILDEENETPIEEALEYRLSFEEQETLVAKISDLLLMIQEYSGDSLE